MDPSKEHGPQPKSTGISRLPQRIASPTRDASLRSNLPRISSRYGASKIVPPVPLGESLNRSIATKIGISSQSTRNRSPSPVRDALHAAQTAALDTTPPSSIGEGPLFNENDENPVQLEKSRQKRKPRPSLTERTLETLAQIPSSPSPTRRRASITGNGPMGPPDRPASSLQNSRPSTASTVRSVSPVKQPFKPPGRNSPNKEEPLPAVPSPGSLFSPPRAFVKGTSLRLTKIPVEQKPVPTSIPSIPTVRTPSEYSAKTMRAKMSSHEAAHRSLESVFKDSVKPVAPSNRLAIGGSPTSSGLLKPRSRGENTIATSPIQPNIERNKANSSKPMSTASELVHQPPQPKLKSSAALRDTIAKAKAARKSAASGSVTLHKLDGASEHGVEGYLQELDIIGSNNGLLKQRIKGAVSSGTLNISAMRLSSIPDAVMTMYNSQEHSVNWAEMVDLTRFNAGDNEITVISDSIFPDWSITELDADEEKSNQFGGLENLDLHNNMLQEIPIGLRRLERLTTLNLSGNKLSNAALSVVWQMPNIRHLNVSRNALSGLIHLDDAKSQSLQSLNLGENKIEALAVADCNSPLQTLDVSNNRLGKLPWQILARSSIVSLNLSGNRLEGVAFEGLTQGFSQLKDLDLSRNAFTSLDSCVSGFTELQTCRVNVNRLATFPDISCWHSLVTLQVSENQLTVLPENLTSLHRLRNVDVSHNNIKNIDPKLAKMEALTSLELAGNPLRERKFLTIDIEELKLDLQKRLADNEDSMSATDADLKGGLGHLVHAAGSETHFRYKPSNGILDLASKGLKMIDIGDIDLDSASTAIHTLRLSNNDLPALPFELLSHPALKWSLKSLDISHNPRLHPTEYVADDLFLPGLQSLYVVSTGLTSLDSLTSHLKAPALTELNISCHRLEGHVPWIRAWFPNCTSLLASDNWFTSIDVEAARGLEVLDIRNNYIETLPRGIGLLGNHIGNTVPGRLRIFECGGNKFRSPRIAVIEKGTEAVLKDLRRMVPASDIPEEWKDEI